MQQQLLQSPSIQLFLNSRPTTRIKDLPSRRAKHMLWSSKQSSQPSVSTDTKQSSPPDPPIMNELNEQTNLLIQCLHQENSNDRDVISSQPIEILKHMMSLYSNWSTTERPTPQIKFKVSATMDKAFRLVTNEAFSTPYQLSWVNLGVEALQLQLYAGDFYSSLNMNGKSTINGKSSIRLITLQPPYNAIPKGTWLKALRALTSKEISSSRSSNRSVKALSPKDASQWTAPSNAAFRILQRLVEGKGVRTFQNNKKRSQEHLSLDERDFNMVLQSYAQCLNPSSSSSSAQKNQHAHNTMYKMHSVIALQERTERAPPLSPVAYSILLKAYGQYKDIKNVEMSIMHAQRNGVVPDIVMANTVVDAYVNCGLLDRAQSVVRSMTRKNGRIVGGAEPTGEGDGFWPLLRPNSRTYNTLLKGMAEEGDVRSAMKLSKVVQTKGLWDDITTNTLVKAAVAGNEFHMAETILSNHTSSETSRRRKVDHPNVEAYTELLDGYAKDGQLENALRVMQLMDKRGVTPNEYTYTCMVGALARNNKVRQARKMINYAASTPSTRGGRRGVVLTPTYNAFISGLLSSESTGQSSHAANIVEVLGVLQEMQDSNIDPNVVTVALVVDGLGRCTPPRSKEARELVQHLEFKSRMKRTNGDYYSMDDREISKGVSVSNKKIATALIRAYGHSYDVDSAIEVFNGIPSPDVVALNAILDACCRCDQLKLAAELFKKHASFKLWNEQQEALANTPGKPRDENKLMSIKPDVVTYTTLISAILQLNSRAATRRASSLYNEMKQKWYIFPDTILIDAVLGAMLSGGPIGFEEDDVKFTLTVLRDGARLDWEAGQYEKRKLAVRSILVGCSSEIWKKDEFAFGLVSEKEPDDPLFMKKGWNKMDSGFRLWGGGNDLQQVEGDSSSVDSFLASKGWNDIDSGFRLL
ncbi:hypothetical protein ACHAXR_008976 [Thalassiosira sp. AJA248-18]